MTSTVTHAATGGMGNVAMGLWTWCLEGSGDTKAMFLLIWRPFLLLEQLEPLSTVGISEQEEASLFIYVCTSSPI